MVRLWVSNEDYGTMSEEAAELYRKAHVELGLADWKVRIEPVADDAPDFLKKEK